MSWFFNYGFEPSILLRPWTFVGQLLHMVEMVQLYLGLDVEVENECRNLPHEVASVVLPHNGWDQCLQSHWEDDAFNQVVDAVMVPIGFHRWWNLIPRGQAHYQSSIHPRNQLVIDECIRIYNFLSPTIFTPASQHNLVMRNKWVWPPVVFARMEQSMEFCITLPTSISFSEQMQNNNAALSVDTSCCTHKP